MRALKRKRSAAVLIRRLKSLVTGCSNRSFVVSVLFLSHTFFFVGCFFSFSQEMTCTRLLTRGAVVLSSSPTFFIKDAQAVTPLAIVCLRVFLFSYVLLGLFYGNNVCFYLFKRLFQYVRSVLSLHNPTLRHNLFFIIYRFILFAFIFILKNIGSEL